MNESISSKLDEYARQYFGEAPADSPDVDMWQPKHDLKSPPGLVGEVTKYINSQCRFPMEHLSVIAAIVSVGNIGGLNHRIDDQKLTSNMMAFGVAGSSAGKEAVLQAFNDLHLEAGLSAAVNGKTKSEQSIIRDLIRNQTAIYNIDEMGLFLRKLNMSHKSGGASYLQGVVAMIMSAYSKSSGSLLLDGDTRDEIKSDLHREMAALNKKIDQGESSASVESRIKAIQDSLGSIDQGLKNPFLSVVGWSSPSIFNESVSFEQVTNGFFGRSIIINEPDTNPRPKRGFRSVDMPDDLKYQLRALASSGEFDISDKRIEARGEKTTITTTQEAGQALMDASDWIFDEADKHTEQTGFEAVVRRGYEMIEKISFILSMGGLERTIEHVEWAVEYVRRDIKYKTNLAYSNVKERTEPVKSMAAKILCSVGEDGITIGRLENRYRVKKQLVEDAIEFLIKRDRIYIELRPHKVNGSLIKMIFAK